MTDEQSEFQTIMDEITDYENDCKACGVNPRAQDSRYCESCHATLVEGQ